MHPSALQFDELSRRAAEIADLSLIIRARFVEAADTMVHLDVRGVRPDRMRTLWPEVLPEPTDHADIRIRYRPSAAAISRAEEVLQEWLRVRVQDEERRILLSRWSLCLAAPYIAGSFRDFCAQTARVRRTAERRIQSEFQNLARALFAVSPMLQEPDWSRISPMMPNAPGGFDRTKSPAPKHETHWLPDDARPVFDAASPELAELAKQLERGNRRRAKMRA
ncbi:MULTISPECIES: DUF6362 family protein [unclassified Rhizobium]|jgi:hypothetical protein|uniref:DUF6362 family protein n=1 Tax=unclassified Rhizobium TaxID=2613769 RepID=UPI0006487EC1|nr:MULTISPECIES: DUF6362 family protein [unclassified Rhizobium]MBN8951434.1 hypothetical protein [Rhizobium tropici]OJY74752.1 MAG: hypothetical protein BGP09_33510 [Rhizobium sp. 60-20]RKD66738.1 hypothetical protein BJ928_106266 [Rhizobium sp. WW_1]